MPDSILDDLTDPQREAVRHIHGPMLVVAGAGSGKTRVVTRRIAHLIREGVKPWQILAMTFTNKAAGEMRERVAQLTGEAPRFVGTFHSLCARFLRQDLGLLPDDTRDGRFTIYDDGDQTGLVKDILKRTHLDVGQLKPRKILSRISRAKSGLVPPPDYADGSREEDAIREIYRRYENALRQRNALDFDDLLVLTVRLLQGVPDCRARYQARFPFLLIDEYQDTNRTQYTLMRLLAGEAANVHVTGDPDQSIYSWRGADYRNIMDFQTDFPTARVVRLEQNYRSTQRILDLANTLIRHNEDRFDKTLFTELPGGPPPRLATLPGDREEADWVARAIRQTHDEGIPLADNAILYRTNAQSRTFEEAFLRHGIPYQILGGLRFYDRREVKDLLAHIKLRVNPRDSVALRRIVQARPVGVGAKTLDTILLRAEEAGEGALSFLARPDFESVYGGRVSNKLRDFARWCQRLAAVPLAPVGEGVREILNRSGLVEHLYVTEDTPDAETRVENLEMLLNRAAEFGAAHPDEDLAAFLEDVALVADVDQWDRSLDAVTLMTLHSAKGLEFPRVYLVGLEANLLPHQNAEGTAALEEERRLFYVGITRAEKALTITRATQRMMWGKMDFALPSPFLAELPAEGVEEVVPDGGGWEEGDDDPDAGDDPYDLDGDWDPVPEPERKPERKTEARKAVGHPSSRAGVSVAREHTRGGEMLTRGGFRTGDLVLHPTFGRGKVLSLSDRDAFIHFFVGGSKMLPLDTPDLRKA